MGRRLLRLLFLVGFYIAITRLIYVLAPQGDLDSRQLAIAVTVMVLLAAVKELVPDSTDDSKRAIENYQVALRAGGEAEEQITDRWSGSLKGYAVETQTFSNLASASLDLLISEQLPRRAAVVSGPSPSIGERLVKRACIARNHSGDLGIVVDARTMRDLNWSVDAAVAAAMSVREHDVNKLLSRGTVVLGITHLTELLPDGRETSMTALRQWRSKGLDRGYIICRAPSEELPINALEAALFVEFVIDARSAGDLVSHLSEAADHSPAADVSASLRLVAARVSSDERMASLLGSESSLDYLLSLSALDLEVLASSSSLEDARMLLSRTRVEWLNSALLRLSDAADDTSRQRQVSRLLTRLRDFGMRSTVWVTPAQLTMTLYGPRAALVSALIGPAKLWKLAALCSLLVVCTCAALALAGEIAAEEALLATLSLGILLLVYVGSLALAYLLIRAAWLTVVGLTGGYLVLDFLFWTGSAMLVAASVGQDGAAAGAFVSAALAYVIIWRHGSSIQFGRMLGAHRHIAIVLTFASAVWIIVAPPAFVVPLASMMLGALIVSPKTRYGSTAAIVLVTMGIAMLLPIAESARSDSLTIPFPDSLRNAIDSRSASPLLTLSLVTCLVWVQENRGWGNNVSRGLGLAVVGFCIGVMLDARGALISVRQAFSRVSPEDELTWEASQYVVAIVAVAALLLILARLLLDARRTFSLATLLPATVMAMHVGEALVAVGTLVVGLLLLAPKERGQAMRATVGRFWRADGGLFWPTVVLFAAGLLLSVSRQNGFVHPGLPSAYFGAVGIWLVGALAVTLHRIYQTNQDEAPKLSRIAKGIGLPGWILSLTLIYALSADASGGEWWHTGLRALACVVAFDILRRQYSGISRAAPLLFVLFALFLGGERGGLLGLAICLVALGGFLAPGSRYFSRPGARVIGGWFIVCTCVTIDGLEITSASVIGDALFPLLTALVLTFPLLVLQGREEVDQLSPGLLAATHRRVASVAVTVGAVLGSLLVSIIVVAFTAPFFGSSAFSVGTDTFSRFLVAIALALPILYLPASILLTWVRSTEVLLEHSSVAGVRLRRTPGAMARLVEVLAISGVLEQSGASVRMRQDAVAHLPKVRLRGMPTSTSGK